MKKRVVHAAAAAGENVARQPLPACPREPRFGAVARPARRTATEKFRAGPTVGGFYDLHLTRSASFLWLPRDYRSNLSPRLQEPGTFTALKDTLTPLPEFDSAPRRRRSQRGEAASQPATHRRCPPRAAGACHAPPALFRRAPMSKKIWIPLLCIVLLGGGWWYWQHSHQSGAASAQTGAPGGHGGRGGKGGGLDGPVPVVAGTVEKRDVPIYLDGLGTVQAFNTVTVKARVDGQIEKVAFTEGQDVKVGDLLAQIDARPYQAHARSGHRQEGAGRGAARQRAASCSSATRTSSTRRCSTSRPTTPRSSSSTSSSPRCRATRPPSTTPAPSSTTRASPRRSPAGWGCGRSTRATSSTRRTRAGSSSSRSSTRSRWCSRCPSKTSSRSATTPRRTTAQDPMKVLAVGRDNTGQLGDGTLAVIDNQIDQTTGTIKLKATFPNDDLRLWPGQFVNARLLLTTRKDGLVVPASVVQRGPQGTYAFVIKPDQTVEARPVKVAQTEDGLALIDDGLQGGRTGGRRWPVQAPGRLQGGDLQPTSGTATSGGNPRAASTAAQRAQTATGRTTPTHRRRWPPPSEVHEHFRAVHPAAHRHVAADGGGDPAGLARLQAAADLRAAGGRFPDDPGVRAASRREPGRDGVRP